MLKKSVGPFSLGDPDELARLIEQAGFRDVEVNSVSFDSRWHDPFGALAMDITAATAVVPALQQMGAEGRSGVIDGIVSHLEPPLDQFIQDGTLVIPWRANVAIATK